MTGKARERTEKPQNFFSDEAELLNKDSTVSEADKE
jgi:hypothetical protein